MNAQGVVWGRGQPLCRTCWWRVDVSAHARPMRRSLKAARTASVRPCCCKHVLRQPGASQHPCMAQRAGMWSRLIVLSCCGRCLQVQRGTPWATLECEPAASRMPAGSHSTCSSWCCCSSRHRIAQLPWFKANAEPWQLGMCELARLLQLWRV